VWLLICSSDDVPALWAAKRLRARGLSPLVVLSPELLHYGTLWTHRVGNGVASSVRFTLADGTRIDGHEIRGVLNRLTVLPPELVDQFASADRVYALQEWTALHISWLACLTVPVLNRPVMQGLCGAWRHRTEWTWLAGQAGLETYPCLLDSTAPAEQAPPLVRGRTVFVIDGLATDESLPPDVAAACGRLGALAETRLLGVDLDADSLRFLGASPRPDLRLGGDAFVDALASTFGVV
jgi:hypothetical protein